MTTIKSYSDLQQSKKLAEFLPLESADMRFCFSHTLSGRITGHYPMIGREPSMGTIPCWSLAALLGVLPLVNFTTPQLIGTPKTLYRCMYNDDLKSHAYDNPVDACVAMVEKLNELNLL